MYKFFACGFFFLTSIVLGALFLSKNISTSQPQNQIFWTGILLYAALYIIFIVYTLISSLFTVKKGVKHLTEKLQKKHSVFSDMIISLLLYILIIFTTSIVFLSAAFLVLKSFARTYPDFTFISQETKQNIQETQKEVGDLQALFHSEKATEFYEKNPGPFQATDDTYTAELVKEDFIPKKDSFGNTYPYSLQICEKTAPSCSSPYYVTTPFIFTQNTVIKRLEIAHQNLYGPKQLPTFTVSIFLESGVLSTFLYPSMQVSPQSYSMLGSIITPTKKPYTIVHEGKDIMVKQAGNDQYASSYLLHLSPKGAITAEKVAIEVLP